VPDKLCDWGHAAFKIEQIRDLVLSHSVKMKKSELTPEQVSSVPCPTCGAAAGEGCVLHSGAPRSEPHVERKFAAIEATERKSGQVSR
jgi:hypothetical protein